VSIYSEVIETRGDYRVRIEADQDAGEPYDDGSAPLLRIEYRSGEYRAEHIQRSSRPTEADGAVEAAVSRWGGLSRDDWRLVEKFMRAYLGTTVIQTWYSGDYWYVAYDTGEWREYAGQTEAVAGPNWQSVLAGFDLMAEWKSYVEGDVWGYIVEKRVTWATGDDDYDDRETWEDAPDDSSCWGLYGHEYAEQAAREALDEHAPEVKA
jgi:hypothetical protein